MFFTRPYFSCPLRTLWSVVHFAIPPCHTLRVLLCSESRCCRSFLLRLFFTRSTVCRLGVVFLFLPDTGRGPFAGRFKVQRICESTTGYTSTPCVGSFTSPGIDTRQKGPPTFSVSSERHRQMWGERNCLSFEMAVGGIEPPSPRLTVRCSTTRPPLPQLGSCFLGMLFLTQLTCPVPSELPGGGCVLKTMMTIVSETV